MSFKKKALFLFDAFKAFTFGLVLTGALWTAFELTVGYLPPWPNEPFQQNSHENTRPLDFFDHHKKIAMSVADSFADSRKYDNGKHSIVRNMDLIQKGNFHSLTYHETLSISGTNQVLAKIVTHFDEFGFRSPSPEKPRNASSFAAIFGCSFVFGDLLPIQHTISEFLQKQMTDYNVYNFGKQGGSANSLLKILDENSNNPLNKIKENEGVFIYLYLPFHLDRAFCNSNCYLPQQNFLLNQPAYELVDGKSLEYKGTFKEDRRYTDWIYKFAANSNVFKYFKLTYPPYYSDQQIRAFVAMVAELRRRVENNGQRKITKSLFVFYYQIPKSEINRFKPILAQYGFNLVESIAEIPVAQVTEHTHLIPLDGHPTARSNILTADTLAKEIWGVK